MQKPKIALITTTIFVPRVLEVYRQLGPDVAIFVTGDRKTPHAETRTFVEKLGNAVYYSDSDQEKLGYASSEIIGWNKIMRRNIALLEAMKDKPDIIITIDDDNLPLDSDYFNSFERPLLSPFVGLKAYGARSWFNIGDFLTPKIYHRGFPYEHRHVDLQVGFKPANCAPIGVVAGLWLGDPDIDAMERLTNRPMVKNLSEVAKSGVILEKGCWSPFNSQNTGYIFELAPLMMVLVGVGRFDDIFASYIAQRVMMDTGHHLYFGPPLVWQERNPQNLWRNLKDEIFGMEHIVQFCNDLRSASLGEGSVLDRLNRLYEQLEDKQYLPPVVHELGKAWCSDVARVLG